jgi:lipopolysaccharide/colanic/teichoic acid biosynthesis glycosyltransferase
MTALRRELAAAPQPTLEVVECDPQLRALDESPSWPVTRLVGWSLTLALGMSALVPVGVAAGNWVGLLVPAIVATLSARALFETLAFGSPHRSRMRHLVPAVPAGVLAGGLAAGSSAVLGDGAHPAASALTMLLALITLTSAGSVRDLEIRVRLGLRRVYFVGSPETRRDLEGELKRRHDARLVGAALSVSGRGLVDSVLAAGATVLVLDGSAMRQPAVVAAASELNLAGVRIRELVSYYESEFKKVPLSELTPTWFLFDIAPIHTRAAYRAFRRACELCAATVLLIASLPLLAAATAAIKLTSPGPALYRQRRVGKNGTQFTLVKLRTMTPGPSTARWAQTEVDRITAVGRLLRRFRVDELPQLANVIKGDLALIGPRPEQVPIAERFVRQLPHYSARHSIRPGLTGWAQVNLGYAGSLEGTIAKLQRDLYYVKHSSLRLDGLILWLTFKALIAGRG